MSHTEVTAESLKQLMRKGEPIFFIEIRRAADSDLALMKVRGALRLTDDELPRSLERIPRERTVVLYSTAPNDDPAFRAARQLAEEGFSQVQVIVGGFKSCLTAGLPVEEVPQARDMARLRGE